MTLKQLPFYLIVVATFACSRSSRLETALALAGDNAPQLQKVLDHYSANEADSLKLKAAVFLIENMPGHVSVDSAKVSEFYDGVNGLLDLRSKMKKNRDSIIAFVGTLEYSKDMIVQDIHCITGDFLISNIDSVFKLWEKPWAKHLTFEEFCEYLLPYKYSEFQHLDNWREALISKFAYALDDVSENDFTYHYPYSIGYALNDAFVSKLKPLITFRPYKLGPLSPFFNSKAINRISFGDCNDYAVINVAMMRSFGVPAVLEYVPQWGEIASGRHGWSTVCNISDFIPIPHTDKDVGDVFFPDRKLPKIFRYQYAPIPEREEYIRNAKYIYNYFAQFEKDITSEYVETRDIAIPVDTKGLADKYAYIAVSNMRTWDIVDFGTIKRGKAHFKNMGMRDIVYIVYGFDGKELKIISDPFILRNTGEITYIKADMNQLDSVKIWRKYPRSENTAKMENRIIGGKIQASTDSLFTKDTTFYEIKDLYYPDLIPIVSDSTYRYWRYLAPAGSAGNIAEVQFFQNGIDSMLTGRLFGTPGENIEHVADNDWLTYYYIKNSKKTAWVAMDFGDTIRIDKVRCVPRSDDNAIHVGDVYELDYFADGKWHSRPQQTAAERYLIFDSVPKNSLMLLKNLSRGKQERIFTYENGKQKWW